MKPHEAWADFVRVLEQKAQEVGLKPAAAHDDKGARAIFLAGFIRGMDYLIDHLAKISTQQRCATVEEITRIMAEFEEESAHTA